MDRTIQPEIQALKNFHILSPVRTTLPNGVPLTVVNAGEQEVVHMDILFAEGVFLMLLKRTADSMIR